MVTIVALGEREVLSIEVNGQRLHPGNVERITPPEPENPYWEIELKDRDGLGSLDSIGQVLSGEPPSFTLLPFPWAACSNTPHQVFCCQALDDVAACCIDQTTV